MSTTEKATKTKATTVETPKVEAPTVEILEAVYGIKDAQVSFTPVVGRKLTNKMVGSDPAPKVKKEAIIKAKVEGKKVTKTFAEGEVIAF